MVKSKAARCSTFSTFTCASNSSPFGTGTFSATTSIRTTVLVVGSGVPVAAGVWPSTGVSGVPSGVSWAATGAMRKMANTERPAMSPTAIPARLARRLATSFCPIQVSSIQRRSACVSNNSHRFETLHRAFVHKREYEDYIVSSKGEGARGDMLKPYVVSGLIGHQVKALVPRYGRPPADGGRQEPLPQGQGADDDFGGPAGAQGMAQHPLRRRDGERPRPLAEYGNDGGELRRIVPPRSPPLRV